VRLRSYRHSRLASPRPGSDKILVTPRDPFFTGGNDYEIYEDPRTIGHAVTKPEDTQAELKKLFNL